MGAPSAYPAIAGFDSPRLHRSTKGAVAQLGERNHGMVEAEGFDSLQLHYCFYNLDVL